MAIPGIVENHAGWVRVVDPNTTPAPAPSLLDRLLGKTRPAPVQPRINATDFLTGEVRSQADRFVAAVTDILNSRTIVTGALGDPADMNQALVGYTYHRLVAMREADRALVELDRTEQSNTAGAEEVIGRMRDVVARTLERAVVAPTADMEALANQVRLRDMQARLPEMAAQLDTPDLDSLDELSARIRALCELTLT